MDMTLSLPPDFSFYETLYAHGWRHLLPFVWDETSQILMHLDRLSNGRVVELRLQEVRSECLSISVSEEVEEAEILSLVCRMLQLDLPLEAFHAYCATRPELAHLPACKRGRLLCSPTLWEDMVKVICTTNTTWTQTKAMTARLVQHFGSPWREDPTRHAFPTPQQIAAVPFAEFAARARLGYRAGAIHWLAQEVASGQLELQTFLNPDLATPELWKKLLALRGIGPYAASCLMLYTGHYGRVNVDSWARTLLARELGRSVEDKDVHAFFEPYGEWRGLAYTFYPWRKDAGE